MRESRLLHDAAEAQNSARWPPVRWVEVMQESRKTFERKLSHDSAGSGHARFGSGWLLAPADLTLAQLHDVLQAAMGWQDCHIGGALAPFFWVVTQCIPRNQSVSG